MKKLALLILLAVFATASATACSKDDKKKDDKAAADKVAADKVAADKAAADKVNAKGVDSDKKKEEAPPVTDRKLSDDGDDDGDGDDDDMAGDDGVMPDPEEADEQADGTEAKDGDKKPVASGDTSFDAAFVKTSMAAFEGLVVITEKNAGDCAKMASEMGAYMKKNRHIKDKVDAIEADPAQKKKWKEATKAATDGMGQRMMTALGDCMSDPAVGEVLESM